MSMMPAYIPQVKEKKPWYFLNHVTIANGILT